MNIPYVFKRCSKCGEWLVASKVNFYKNKGKKYGLESKCKKCEAKQKKQYYEINKDKIAEQGKQWYKKNKDKIAERSKQYREDNKDKKAEYDKQWYKKNKDKKAEYDKQWYKKNKDKIAEISKQYYDDNKDKILERCKQYREKNKDKIAERSKQYYDNNKEYHAKWMKQYYEINRDKIAEQGKQYREANKDKIAEYQKQYYATPQGQVVYFNRGCKRRLRKQNQGNGINKDQWLEMMKYFNFTCAYSGEKLTKYTRSIDHIIPLSKDGEHEIWNVVPMYRSYNLSKHDKDMLQWYKEQTFFSEERLNKIYEWQEYAYKKWHDKEEII